MLPGFSVKISPCHWTLLVADWPLMLVIMSLACGPTESAARHPRPTSTVPPPTAATVAPSRMLRIGHIQPFRCRYPRECRAGISEVAGRRLPLVYEPSSRRYCGWLPEVVAQGLSPSAPQNLLAFANVRTDETLSTAYYLARHESLAIHLVTLCRRPPRENARTRRYTRPRASSPPAVEVCRSGQSGAGRGDSGSGFRRGHFLFHSW